MYDVWAVWLLYDVWDVWDVWAVWAVWPYIGVRPCVNAVWHVRREGGCEEVREANTMGNLGGVGWCWEVSGGAL